MHARDEGGRKEGEETGLVMVKKGIFSPLSSDVR